LHAEDPIIVGVINRKRDLITARNDSWYRIPYVQMQHGVFAEYIAFFLSGKPFKDLSGSIAYYAPIKGIELSYRYELLPKEANHPRANDRYYRLSLGKLQPKTPPIRNASKRVITFIYTTGDRFLAAQTIRDLYSEADHFVERIVKQLNHQDFIVEQLWTAEKAMDDFAPGIRIKHTKTIDQTAATNEYTLNIDRQAGEDAVFAAIRKQIEQADRPFIINIPLD
jgi:hypothetical protein